MRRKRVVRKIKFTESEKHRLLKLVTENLEAIECKKISATTAQTKIEAWRKMADEFNACGLGHRREYSALRSLWEGLRRKARAVISTENKNLIGTRSRMSSAHDADPVLHIAVGLVRRGVGAHDDDGHDDSDSSNDDTASRAADRQLNADSNDQHEGPSSFQLDHEVQSSDMTVNDQSQFSPTALNAPVSPALCKLRVKNEVVLFDNYIKEEMTENISPSENRHHAVTTGPLSNEAVQPESVSWNIPVLKKPEAESITESKLSTPPSSTALSDKEYSVQMEILHIQKLQELEKLKQEKIKTDLLLQELEKLRQEKRNAELLNHELQNRVPNWLPNEL